MTMRFAATVISLVVLLLSGCINLGPDYQRPEAEVEPDWIEIEDSRVTSEPATDPKWWQSAFQDPELDKLVEAALQQNLTLRSAGLRVLQSQQQLAIAVGNQYPQQQQATGSASRQKDSDIIFNNYNLGLTLGWEIDFWGRFSRQVESASAGLDASVANYDGALVSMVSQAANNYILIRTYQERIEVARINIKLQAESLRIAQAKFDAGAVSELDVDQAESLLNNTKATLSSLEVSLQQFKNALAVLLGNPPQEFNGLLTKKGSIPAAQTDVALGMPQDLIRRRPDVRVAERQLAAQSAQIGFAVTELYPHLTIGGGIGTSAMESGDLFESNSETWNLFGMFEWNIFNYGRLQSNVRLQDARFQQLLIDYRNTVLQAQGETENAIVAYLKSHEQFQSYSLAAAASQRAVDVATIQYQEGAIDFNTLISTLNANQQQQDLMTATQGSVATSLVQVYKALGGGWEIRDNRDPVDLLPATMKDEMRERTRAWDGVLK
ncbi:MAG: efflux transporter outer membrane subunit [Desulfuromonadales bacterium]|nr:efflux transporter outer membrane subunit [Desulfuromonadales bacterium]